MLIVTIRHQDGLAPVLWWSPNNRILYGIIREAVCRSNLDPLYAVPHL
jgi:hypothetical protein